MTGMIVQTQIMVLGTANANTLVPGIGTYMSGSDQNEKSEAWNQEEDADFR